MSEYVAASYGLTGKELERRLGAIASNAVNEARRAHGVENLPMMDSQYQVQEIVRNALANLVKNYEQEVPVGSLVSPTQTPRNHILDKIMPQFEAALGGLELETAVEPRSRGKQAAA